MKRSKLATYGFDPSKYVLLPPRPQDIIRADLGAEIKALRAALAAKDAEIAELKKDAALGAAVRRMLKGYSLVRCSQDWSIRNFDEDEIGCGITPESAMIAAGLMKGEEE